MAPNANILITTPLDSSDRLQQHPQPQLQHPEQQHGSHLASAPVISAPSPAFTFTVSRHLPILRNGLTGSLRSGFAGSISSIGSGSGTQSGPVAQSQQQHQPVLNRLRSQGPPPYIPMAPETALPRLPPEYNTAIIDPLNASTSTTTGSS
ncbi:hypothetical protein BGZ96_012299 [Linnemannia gamsii]|uniref:Uncharacterized protein n=1 Tax=Linnemannia gamsii TaxID=64522 RepID=A0ABQ7KAM5_9FUNG|nr:hypothetical protein BGZ96_012299 [Linnemannia gamsii]